MERHMISPDVSGLACVYERPGTLTDTPFHYCPGCGHGVVHRVLMEAVDELGYRKRRSASRRSGAPSSPTTT